MVVAESGYSSNFMMVESDNGALVLQFRDGDIVRLDADKGTLECLTDLTGRTPATADLSGNGTGVGRELFEIFRRSVGPSTDGAAVVL